MRTFHPLIQKHTTSIEKQADCKSVEIFSYTLIYDLFDGVKTMLNHMLDPIVEKKYDKLKSYILLIYLKWAVYLDA